jgi:hypothetical protein
MLVEKSSVAGPEFHKEFNKRFTSFAHKAPIPMSFMLTPNGVSIYMNESEENKNLLFSSKFDFSKTVKENIKDIKDILLEKFYPQFQITKKEYVEYSAEELNEFATSGKDPMSYLDAKKEVISKEVWRIEKIITMRDELFIRNLNENRCYRYKLRSPVTIFLRQYREATNKEALFTTFLNKSIFLNEIYDDYEERMKEER